MVKAHVTIEPNLFRTNKGTKKIIVHGEYKADQPENKATKRNLKMFSDYYFPTFFRHFFNKRFKYRNSIVKNLHKIVK